MSMIEGKAARPWRECLAQRCAQCHDARALLFGVVNIGRNLLPVPVEQLGMVGLVDDIDGDGLALFEPQQRSGKLAVVESCRNNLLRPKLGQPVRDLDRVIGVRWRLGVSGSEFGGSDGKKRETAQFQKSWRSIVMGCLVIRGVFVLVPNFPGQLAKLAAGNFKAAPPFVGRGVNLSTTAKPTI